MILSHLYPSDEDEDAPLDIDTPIVLSPRSPCYYSQRLYPQSYPEGDNKSSATSDEMAVETETSATRFCHPMSPLIAHPYGIDVQPLRRRSNSYPETSPRAKVGAGTAVSSNLDRMPVLPHLDSDEARICKINASSSHRVPFSSSSPVASVKNRRVFQLWKRMVFVIASYMVIMALSLKESGVDTIDVYSRQTEKIPLLRGNQYVNAHTGIQHNIGEVRQSKSGIVNGSESVGHSVSLLSKLEQNQPLHEKDDFEDTSIALNRKRDGKTVRRPNIALAKRNNVDKHTQEYKANHGVGLSILSSVNTLDNQVPTVSSGSSASICGFLVVIVGASLVAVKVTREIISFSRRRS